MSDARNDATEACQTTEQCVDNECVAKCPSECDVDADCAACGVDTQQPATACRGVAAGRINEL